MTDPVSYIMLGLAALAGLGRDIKALWKTRLSKAEQELLAASLTDEGKFRRMPVDNSPDILLVGDGHKKFYFVDDLETTIKYLEAFENLQACGYVSHSDGHVYQLTCRGFKKARKLATRKKSGK